MYRTILVLAILILASVSAGAALDLGIDKIPFVSAAPIIDGVADPVWSTIRNYRFDFLWMGESNSDNPVLNIRIAHDQANLYGFVKIEGVQSSPTSWDEWQIGNYVVVCFAATGRHGLPFRATDSEIVLRHDGVKLCKPATWVLSDIAISAIRTNANGWDGEFAILLAKLGYSGSETVGLAVVLRQVGTDGHPKFVGSIANSPIAIDKPSVWQSVPIDLQYETPWVTDRDFKSTPDGSEVQSGLYWHITDSTGQSFSCQHMLHKGWLEVNCLPGVTCPPKDAIVTHLKGTFTTDSHGVRRLLASEVNFFGGLPVVKPVFGSSRTLSALNAGLFFSVAGRITSATAGGFVVDDGGTPVNIVGELPIDISVGDFATFNGTSHFGGTGPYLSLTNVVKK